jgi:hypothetical protein
MGKHLKTPVSVRFSEEEMALLDKMAERHGTKAAALVAGLRMLDGQNAITPEEALAALAIELGLDPPRRKTKRT